MSKNKLTYFVHHFRGEIEVVGAKSALSTAIYWARVNKGTIQPYHNKCDVFIPLIGCVCGEPYPNIPEELRYKKPEAVK